MRAIALALGLVVLAPTVARADEPAPTKMKNKPLFIGGIVTGSVGVAGMSVGGVIMLLDAMIPKPVPQLFCAAGSACPRVSTGPSPAMVMGATILGVGGALTLISIPMLAIGAKRVPLDMQPSGPNGSAGMTLRLTF
jgi:hypothetical protein